MAIDREFTITARGVGRRDYSHGTSRAAEPVLRSHENVYGRRITMTVGAEDSETEDVEVESGQVVILHDFVASRPSTALIRMVVQSVVDGTATDVFDKSGYGVVEEHSIKGYPFTDTIRIIIYNYEEVAETLMRIALTGFYTSTEEYNIRV